ncbi:MAG: MlaD family protein [Dissulfurispiraceae bacterium]
MSKKANKTLIGAFVLGAIALAIAAVVIFGSGQFFKKTQKFVMFFEGSVKGLQVGAPVVFQGVKIGEVIDIKLVFDPKDLSALIPVYVEVDPKKVITLGTGPKIGDNRFIKALIAKGLKAQLQLQSFVTGQLMINLDFYPDKPIRLVGTEKKYPEIPTIPTPLDQLLKTIQDLNLDQIVKKMDSAIGGVDKLVNSAELKESISSLNEMLKSVNHLAKNVDAHVNPIASDIHEVSTAARSSLVQLDKTLAMKEGVPGEIASEVKNTLKAARVALDETDKALENIKHITAQNANLGYEIERSVDEFTALARSLRTLTDYLERHPEAFIRGKNPSKGD